MGSGWSKNTCRWLSIQARAAGWRSRSACWVRAAYWICTFSTTSHLATLAAFAADAFETPLAVIVFCLRVRLLCDSLKHISSRMAAVQSAQGIGYGDGIERGKRVTRIGLRRRSFFGQSSFLIACILAAVLVLDRNAAGACRMR